MIPSPIANNFNNLRYAYNARQSENIAYENTKGIISNLINSAIIEFLELKNQVIAQGLEEIRTITEALSFKLRNIDTNIYKCTNCLFKVKSARIATSETDLNENFLLKPENQAAYILFNRMLNDSFSALPEDSKRKIFSQFDDFYFKFEKIETEKITANIKLIKAARSKLNEVSESGLLAKHNNDGKCAKEEIESSFFQSKKDYEVLDQTFEIKFLYNFSSSNFKPIFDIYGKMIQDFDDEYWEYKSNIDIFKDNHIYFFTNQHYLTISDINTKSHKKLKLIGVKKNFSNASLVPIPGKRVFICENTVANPCIINIEKAGTNPSPSGLDCLESGGVYFKNSVYIYGERTTNQLDLDATHMYSLIRGTWKRLASLPHPAHDCSINQIPSDVFLDWNSL